MQTCAYLGPNPGPGPNRAAVPGPGPAHAALFGSGPGFGLMLNGYTKTFELNALNALNVVLEDSATGTTWRRG